MVETVDVQVARSWLPSELEVEREQRVRRAQDLRLKKKQLPEALRDYNPMDFYLKPYLVEAQRRRLEYEELNYY